MALTPQMRQSIYILQLPLLELRTYLKQQMEENPLLEDMIDSSSLESKEDWAEGQSASNEQLDRLIELSGKDRQGFEEYFNPGYSQEETREKQDYRESLITQPPTLQEYLLKQLRLCPLTEIDYKIGESIIGNIDENGYFQGTIDEVAETEISNGVTPLRNKTPESASVLLTAGTSTEVKVTSQDVQRVLSSIQTFEPPGVGARNLKECLLIQLKAKGKQGSLAYQVVENYLVELAKNRTELIARRLKAPLNSVKEALKEIYALNPKPGRAFGRMEKNYTLPDIIVEKKKHGYEVIINDRESPRLRISPQYKNLLNRKEAPEDVKRYLKEKLSSALWLIKTVGQRQQTIHRVAECIVRLQREFFEEEKGCLKPLTMKQVAEIVGRNESTISRVVNSKYIQTPHGIFELSYFFSGFFKTDREGVVSTDAVKMQIATLIEGEDRQKPLSDTKIINILHAQGINVARRTVAKYREELKILPSHFRKK